MSMNMSMNYHVIVDELDLFDHGSASSSSSCNQPCCTLSESSWDLEDFEEIPLDDYAFGSNTSLKSDASWKSWVPSSLFGQIKKGLAGFFQKMKQLSFRKNRSQYFQLEDGNGLAGIHRAKLQRWRDSRRKFYNIL